MSNTSSSPPTNPTSTDSNPTPSSTQPPPPSPPQHTQPYRPLFLALVFTTPLLALLPPRKLDLYTFSLASAFILSAEELTLGPARRQRTGSTGVMGVLGSAQVDAPSDAREGRLRPGLGTRTGQKGEVYDDTVNNTSPSTYNSPTTQPQPETPQNPEGGVLGLARRLWMGDEKPGWEKRRLEKEKEDLEEGKGYGDIIMEQVREVFPGFAGGGREEGRGEGGKER